MLCFMSDRLKKIIEILSEEYKDHKFTAEFEKINEDPFKTLISTILSQRTRDENTIAASHKLFDVASTPKDILKLSLLEIETLIKESGFYNVKARRIKEVSEFIDKDFKGKVPSNMDDLLKLPGVGRKTANIILAYSFKQPAIAIDTHVHRIVNRIGLIKTHNSYDTEMDLLAIVPKEYCNIFNTIIVRHGQEVCNPVSPKCSVCKISEYCDKVGVYRSR